MKKSIYNEAFIANLFNQMSGSYKNMNSLASLGFYPLWRRRAIEKMRLKEGEAVTDLLTGSGECWKHILDKIGFSGKLTALDFSEGMLHRARFRREQYVTHTIEILAENVFKNSIPAQSQDVVICAYGIKTFTPEQLADFAEEIHRILKPCGRFSLVEVLTPPNKWLRKLYFFYLSRVMPFLAYILSGNAKSHGLLRVYTENFKTPCLLMSLLTEKGFVVTQQNCFYGCAGIIYGTRAG